jgi:hypothetical protein
MWMHVYECTLRTCSRLQHNYYCRSYTHTYVNTIYLRVFHHVIIYFICYPFISFANFCSRAYLSSAQRISNRNRNILFSRHTCLDLLSVLYWNKLNLFSVFWPLLWTVTTGILVYHSWGPLPINCYGSTTGAADSIDDCDDCRAWRSLLFQVNDYDDWRKFTSVYLRGTGYTCNTHSSLTHYTRPSCTY